MHQTNKELLRFFILGRMKPPVLTPDTLFSQYDTYKQSYSGTNFKIFLLYRYILHLFNLQE